jgi:hypothetical protein
MRAFVDHILICTKPRAPAAERLIAAGWREGASNAHDGQGTANRRFFFANMMLELLFVTRAETLRQSPLVRSGIAERCAAVANTCPFGFALRVADPDQSLPFETWSFDAPFLPPGMAFRIATCSDDVRKPLLFVLPSSAERTHPFTPPHLFGGRTITAIDLFLPADIQADMRPVLAPVGELSCESADEPLIHVTFDGASAGQQLDFRPDLPLTASY